MGVLRQDALLSEHAILCGPIHWRPTLAELHKPAHACQCVNYRMCQHGVAEQADGQCACGLEGSLQTYSVGESMPDQQQQ